MRHEQILRIGGFAPHLRIEVQPTRRQAALPQHHQHRPHRVVQIHRELVGVPAVLRIAAVGVDAAQQARIAGHLQIVLETVPGQRGVVGLDVELEILVQPVLAQETHHRGAVEIVLVLHRLHRLGLDQEIALEADAASVVARQSEEARQMLLLAPHLRVVQARIALATAPEHVVLPAQGHRRLQRRLDLHRRARHHVEIRVGRRTVHIARMREQIGRAPQQLDAGVGLALLGDADHVL